jgi:hypothetical protein
MISGVTWCVCGDAEAVHEWSTGVCNEEDCTCLMFQEAKTGDPKAALLAALDWWDRIGRWLQPQEDAGDKDWREFKAEEYPAWVQTAKMIAGWDEARRGRERDNP